MERVGHLDHRRAGRQGAALAGRRLIGRGRRVARRLRHLGASHRCPVCRAALRRFVAAQGRPDAACPVCGSLERQRLLWLYLERRGLARSGTVVFVAPDPATEHALRRRPGLRVISGDLEGGRGAGRLDLTALELPDASADLLLASHVLEHVEDDAAAFAETARVLRPGGEALLQVPLYPGATVEDPSVRTPEGRRAAFGQEDHVRRYGTDIAERVAAAGLETELLVLRDAFTEAERRRYGLVHAHAPDPAAAELWTIVRAVRAAAA